MSAKILPVVSPRELSHVSGSNYSASTIAAHTPIDLDWYGNNALHHAFGGFDVDIDNIKKIIRQNPSAVAHANQFGRLPLHYAVDRIKVSYEGIKLLIDQYPSSVRQRDQEGNTPYDLAVKWNHSKSIRWLFLEHAPTLNWQEYIKIKYGPLATIAHLAARITKPHLYNTITHENDENEESNSMHPLALSSEYQTSTISNMQSVASVHTYHDLSQEYSA